jgi:hypothetical protein
MGAWLFSKGVLMDARKLISYLIAGVVGYYIAIAILPYVVLFLAAYGGWHLYQEYQKNRKRKL